MKKLIVLLSSVIEGYFGLTVLDLVVIRRFSIAMNCDRYDHVFLVHDLLSDSYFVIWKWSLFCDYSARRFDFYSEAYNFYCNRHDFACICN